MGNCGSRLLLLLPQEILECPLTLRRFRTPTVGVGRKLNHLNAGIDGFSSAPELLQAFPHVVEPHVRIPFGAAPQGKASDFSHLRATYGLKFPQTFQPPRLRPKGGSNTPTTRKGITL